jgi:hypothetical protein
MRERKRERESLFPSQACIISIGNHYNRFTKTPIAQPMLAALIKFSTIPGFQLLEPGIEWIHWFVFINKCSTWARAQSELISPPAHHDGWMDGWMVCGQEMHFSLYSYPLALPEHIYLSGSHQVPYPPMECRLAGNQTLKRAQGRPDPRGVLRCFWCPNKTWTSPLGASYTLTIIENRLEMRELRPPK